MEIGICTIACMVCLFGMIKLTAKYDGGKK